MSKKFTHTQCFAHFDTVPRNVQWSWSARNEDKGIVAVTLWRDEFKREGDVLVYQRGPIDPEARVRLGHNELMGNLRWALDNLNGSIKVIAAIAKDGNASPRTIRECGPTNMRASVTTLDESTGSFRIEATL